MRKILTGKWRSYRDGIVRPYESEKPGFSNSSGLKGVFEKLRFRDRSVWTVANQRTKAAVSNFFGVVWTGLVSYKHSSQSTRSWSDYYFYFFVREVYLICISIGDIINN